MARRFTFRARVALFFRQAVGRVRRRLCDPADLVATVFLPADPTLTACAEHAERLRIPGSVEAIDNGLQEATAGR